MGVFMLQLYIAKYSRIWTVDINPTDFRGYFSYQFIQNIIPSKFFFYKKLVDNLIKYKFGNYIQFLNDIQLGK